MSLPIERSSVETYREQINALEQIDVAITTILEMLPLERPCFFGEHSSTRTLVYVEHPSFTARVNFKGNIPGYKCEKEECGLMTGYNQANAEWFTRVHDELIVRGDLVGAAMVAGERDVARHLAVLEKVQSQQAEKL